MILIDGHVTCRAVDFAGGWDDKAAHIVVERRLTHVECALYVGVDIAFGGDIAVGDGYQRSEMKHRVASLRYVTAERRVAHIAAHHFKARMLYVIEPAPVIE